MKTLAIVCGLSLAIIAYAQNEQPPAEAPPPADQAAPAQESPPAEAQPPVMAEPQQSETSTTAPPVSTEAAPESQ